MAGTPSRSLALRVGLWAAAGVAVIAIVVIAIVVLRRPETPPAAGTGPSASPAGRGTRPPWNAPADASAAVATAGLPMLGEEGNALHFHTHLDIIVNGTPVRVPANIGVDEVRRRISPLHSHDTTGVIHIESATKDATFTLGQFFAEWQVPLAADHIGALTADSTNHLTVYVNGRARPGDPASIVLAAHDEIAIVYGTDAQQTNVPSSYRWTNGL